MSLRVFLVPVELRGSVRHGFSPEILSSLLDLAIYGLWQSLAQPERLLEGRE